MKKIRLFILLMTILGSGCKQEKTSWTGVFEANSSNMYGELALNNNQDSVKFQLYSMVDENMGSFEGSFYPSGDTAVFEKEGCKITFKFISDSIVQVKNQEGYCFAGLGVYYEGMYYRTKENFEELDLF